MTQFSRQTLKSHFFAVRRLLIAAALCVPLAGCEAIQLVEMLKPQSVKDAEEKKEFMDSCIESAHMWASIKQSKAHCECSYKEWKIKGQGLFDSGMKCAEKTFNKTIGIY